MAPIRSPGKASSIYCNPTTDPQEVTERLMMTSSTDGRILVIESHNKNHTLLRHIGAQFGEVMQSPGTLAMKNEFEAGLSRDLEEENKDLGERMVAKEVN